MGLSSKRYFCRVMAIQWTKILPVFLLFVMKRLVYKVSSRKSPFFSLIIECAGHEVRPADETDRESMGDREQRDWAFKALTKISTRHLAALRGARSGNTCPCQAQWIGAPMLSLCGSSWLTPAGNANGQELRRNQGVCEQGQAALEEVFMKFDYGWDGSSPPHCLSFPVRRQQAPFSTPN